MITACIITRDQQEKLEKCLQHLSQFKLEIVVVDTGSEDESKTIARKYTNHVYDFEWMDDFAAARNYAIDKAPTDIVFSVDSDEYVMDFDENEIIQNLQKFSNQIGQIKLTNIFNSDEIHESDEWLGRIFDRRYCHYVGRIHEQIERVDGKETAFFCTSTHVLHDGYLLDEHEWEKKTERNISLLKQELDSFLTEYDGQDLLSTPQDVQSRAAYILYQLGKSYYTRKDYLSAIEYFELGLSFDLNEKLVYVIDMVNTYGYALINAGQAQKALLLESVYNNFCDTADFCFLMGIIYMNNERVDQAVKEFLKATSFQNGTIRGANSYLAYYNVGVIRECEGNLLEAKKYYQLAGDYENARLRLERLK